MNRSNLLSNISNLYSRAQHIAEFYLNIKKLTRLNIFILILCSTYFGFLLSGYPFSYKTLSVLFAVFFHFLGNSIINQFQERKTDANLERTKDRPLVTGYFDPYKSLAIGIFFIFLSLLIALIIKNQNILYLLLLNFIIYHLIYTPLKTKTSFAILIGSICGALPPLIGWFIENNYLNYKIIFVATTFYLWQVPHFLFLTEKYENSYKNSNYKVLINNLNKKNYSLITNLWLATYFYSLVFTFYHLEKDLNKLLLFVLIEITIFYKIFKSNNATLKFILINFSIILLILFYLFL